MRDRVVRIRQNGGNHLLNDLNISSNSVTVTMDAQGNWGKDSNKDWG